MPRGCENSFLIECSGDSAIVIFIYSSRLDLIQVQVGKVKSQGPADLNASLSTQYKHISLQERLK